MSNRFEKAQWNLMGYILVVEDETTILNLLQEILESEGYRVQGAGDGKEALDVMQRALPELVISDIMMPRLDGLSLLRQMKSASKMAHIPVILLTAATLPISEVKGAVSILYKPFDIDQFLSTVERYMPVIDAA